MEKSLLGVKYINKLSLPKVVIVGKPNVGKSSLFNCLLRKNASIIHNKSGVTRDCLEEVIQFFDIPFICSDTAGLTNVRSNLNNNEAQLKTFNAIKKSNIIFFVIDGKNGIDTLDKDIAVFLLKQKKPIIIVANKCDGSRFLESVDNLYLLLSIKFPIIFFSSKEGDGLIDLYDALKNEIGLYRQDNIFDIDLNTLSSLDKALKVIIIGRPNVGKSTLINYLLSTNAMLTGKHEGLTRDSVSFPITFKDRYIKLIDTAGLKKINRIKDEVETLSIKKTLDSIKTSDIVVLLADQKSILEKNELNIARTILNRGKPLFFIINKIDQIEEKDLFLKEIKKKLNNYSFLFKDIPCIAISAKLGSNCGTLLNNLLLLDSKCNQKINTSKLNVWLREAVKNNPPSSYLKIKYITQIKTKVPEFVLFTNKSCNFPENYRIYLINKLKEKFDLYGIPIKLIIRTSNNPYI